MLWFSFVNIQVYCSETFFSSLAVSENQVMRGLGCPGCVPRVLPLVCGSHFPRDLVGCALSDCLIRRLSINKMSQNKFTLISTETNVTLLPAPQSKNKDERLVSRMLTVAALTLNFILSKKSPFKV